MSFEIRSTAESWELLSGGRTVIRHTAASPFAVLRRKEKTYKVSRGAVKASETVLETLPLTKWEADGEGVTFYGDGGLLRLTVSDAEGGFSARLAEAQDCAVELRFAAGSGEPVFGGGEQYRQLDLKGQRVVNLVSEHITLPTVLEKGLLPTALYRPKRPGNIGSYSPMPVFVFGGRCVLAFDTDSDGESSFDKNASVFSFDACPQGFYFRFADSFRTLSKLINARLPNRQYLPDWCLDGMILGIQGGTERILKTAFAARDAGMPVCGVWSQDWSGAKITAMGKQVNWNWEADSVLYPGLADAIAKLRERDIRFLSYINPYLVKDGPLYDYCKGKGYLITRSDGEIYHIKSTTFSAGMLDLTNPEAAAYIKRELIIKNMLSLGVSGYMADFGEYLPLDCVLHDGAPALLHNRWPVLWAKLNREAVEEFGDPDVMFFSRAGYSGVQQYAPVMWNGDQHVDFTPDYGMPCVMPASFSLGFSGVPLVHCDVGGFFSFMRMKRTKEVLLRWLELSAFSICMRSHESLRPDDNIQPYDPEVLPQAARMARIHAALKPYLRRCLAEAKEGVPVMRPDFYETGYWTAHKDEYSYYLGDDLFVSPVVIKGAVTRRVSLPEGIWVHMFTGKEYPAGSYEVSAPLGTPAVFYRQGSEFTDCFRNCAAAAATEDKK